MASGPAGPLVHPHGVLTPRRESHGRNRLWPSLRPLLLPPRLPRRYPFRPVATTPSLWELLFSEFHPPLTSDLDALGAAAELQFGDSAARYPYADWAWE